MMPRKPTHPATRRRQAAGSSDASTGGIVPPIQPATTYERDAGNRLLGASLYSRADNPVTGTFEKLLAELELGASAAVFGSGMAASAAVFRR